MPPTPARMRLMGMPISVVTERDAIDYVFSCIGAGRGGWVITPNLDQLRLFRARPEVRPMYEQADLILADGMPLIWASRLQKTPLPERVPGSGLIFSLSEAAAGREASVFFLGGNPGAAEACAARLVQMNPALKVSGCYCPPFGFDKDAAELSRIKSMLAEKRPDIVYVGLGFPKQEKLIEQLRLAHRSAWYLGIGISFSFVAGEVRRAPRWMQKIGLEWVHRMVQEPGRLFKRYMVHGIPFAIRLFSSALGSRFFQRRPR